MPPSEICDHLSVFSELVIQTVLFSEEDAAQQKPLHDYLVHYRHVNAYTSGDDLRKRGIPPSPLYEEILNQLKAAWLDGKVNSYEEEISLLNTILTST